MPTMKNPETGETMEMTTEELMEAMREGKISIQQQVHHADGTVTSSTIYGNEIGDGIDRSMNVFGTMNDIFTPALTKAKEIKKADENAENLFFMDNSDVDYEVIIDDTAMPVMHIVTCTKEKVTIARYTRDERRTVGVSTNAISVDFENGEIHATLDEIKEHNMILFAFGLHEIRKILRERGILQELQKIGNKGSGVIITSDEGEINAKIVRGLARPELPCMMFGGLFAQGIEDAVMMRPYVDELMTAAMYEDMSLEEKIAAAEDGDTDLMNQLAMYYLDECDEPEAEKAVYWFEKMAEVGISTAMFSLGLHYAKGFGVGRNFEKAAYWMQQAADNGDEDAVPIAEEYAKIAATKEKADAGDAQAQADMVGHFTRMASSLDQAGEDADFALAFEYAQKSAAQSNGDGIWGLALCYEHGRGVDEDIDKAIELYRKGAELGHAPSQHSLACFFMRGDYLDEDHDAAFELCEKAALQGYKLAEFGLAKMYELGMGCEESLDKALEWGEKAATDGDANTQYEVAKLYTYTNDDGEMIDAERAKYWYSQAAEQGHEMAAGALNFGPMWGDMEGFDDEADFEEDEEDLTKKEESRAQAKEFIETVIKEDNGVIKSLLTNTDDSFGFETLCEDGYIFFDIDEIDWDSAKDCMFVVAKEENQSLFGGVSTNYSIDIVYKFAVNNLSNYRTRAMELCYNLNEMLNDSEIGDGKKLSYLMCQSQNITNEYGVTTLTFTTDEVYLPNGVVNIFADYNKDTAAIINDLWGDEDFKKALGLTGRSAQEAFDEGYIQFTDNFDENYEKGYDSWLSLTWDFSFDTSINIVPVVRNKKQLKPIVLAIKKNHKTIELPARGTINYEPEYSQEKMELTDGLFVAMLMFKQKNDNMF